MKKLAFVLIASLTLSGCTIFKTRLVPQAYMPEAPEILLRAPKELHTIRQEPKPVQQEEAPKND